jgi:hypothetical protein
VAALRTACHCHSCPVAVSWRFLCRSGQHEAYAELRQQAEPIRYLSLFSTFALTVSSETKFLDLGGITATLNAAGYPQSQPNAPRPAGIEYVPVRAFKQRKIVDSRAPLMRRTRSHATHAAVAWREPLPELLGPRARTPVDASFHTPVNMPILMFTKLPLEMQRQRLRRLVAIRSDRFHEHTTPLHCLTTSQALVPIASGAS